VLLNLLQNAVKFTMRGSIMVYASYDAAHKMLKISVSDTGIGISVADQAKLFRLFGKLSATSSMNTSGIGLGLSICKRIVETFGGKILV
jgi:signal transduction histidine kinase